MPGVNWPLDADELILGQWRAQIARNRTNDRFRPGNTAGKLTETDRHEIRALYAGGIFSQRALARMFDVSQTTIHETITRRTA